MTPFHLSRELLRAIERRELPPRALTQAALDHLMHLCPHCRQEFEAFQRERGSGAPVDYSGALKALPALLERAVPRLVEEERRAREDLAVLLSLPPDERRLRLRRSRTRFRGTALARLLIGESRKRLPGQWTEAYHLADLARSVLHLSANVPGVFDLIALATAHMANALRTGGDRRAADEHFGHVQYVVSHEGVTAPDVLAEVADLESSLRKDQRRFVEAEELLARAAMLYRMTGSDLEMGKVLLNLAALYNHQGEVGQAIEATRAALRRISREAEPRLYLCGRYNLAYFHVEAGAYEQAADLLTADQDLYAAFPEPWTQLRLKWLQGDIARGRGAMHEAEQAYRETRDGFIAEGIGYDAAMVSLDLALLYLAAGRTGEVTQLAEEMLPVFEAQDVHREAAAALMLFQDAARREALSGKLVRELAAYLREARENPALRFGEA